MRDSNAEVKNQRKRKEGNNDRRGIDTSVHTYNDLYPKWVIKLMEEINPKKAPKPIPPKYPIIYAIGGGSFKRPKRSQMSGAPQGTQIGTQISENHITRISIAIKVDADKAGVGVEYRKRGDNKRLYTAKAASLYFEGKTLLEILDAVLKGVEKDQQLVIISYDKGVVRDNHQLQSELNAVFKYKIIMRQVDGLNERAKGLPKLANNALSHKINKVYNNE